MSLAAGTRLGSYEIVGPLGAGGMGEVFRARDTKLDREVAIKVLPERLASDAPALARFEREAKAVAALSHPNILAIFDFGSDHGIAYAVTELLDGETLREKLGTTEVASTASGGSTDASGTARPTVPLRKALDYAVQMARGLAAAHAKGIAHRDLKPENVFITGDGRVKILDFGLALRAAAPDAGLTASPTMARHTDPGTVLGTVGYMSPEQVRGDAGDQRSDIFSFGAVLYELVSGQRAFQRSTAAETMTAILNEDPPAMTARSDAALPPALETIVLHCLEKTPAERFQSASDVAFALQALSGSSTSAAQAVPAVQGRRRRWLTLGAGLAGAILLVGAGFLAGLARSPQPRQVSFLPLTYQPQTIFRGLFAPDGKTFVYSAALRGDPNDVEIYTVSSEYPGPRSLGLKKTQLLSISKTGELAVLTNAQWVGHRLFEGTLGRVPLGGGAPRQLLDRVREAAWGPDGESLAVIRDVDGRDRLEFPIGTVLLESSGYVSDLRVAPDGQHVAFLEHPVKYDDRGGVAVVDLAGNKTALADGFWGLEGIAWSPDGHEVLFSAGLSYAQFIVYGVTLAGERRQALESAGGLTLYDIAADGRWLLARDDISFTMMVKTPGSDADINLSWLDFSQPAAFSADGRTILFTEESGALGSNYAVCLRGTDGSPVVRLGEGAAQDLSPDGRWALGVVSRERQDDLMLYPTGAGESRKLEPGPIQRYSDAHFFPDNRRVAVCGSAPGQPSHCYEQNLDGGPPRLITEDSIDRAWPSAEGMSVLARRTSATDEAGHAPMAVYPLDGGTLRPTAGLEFGDTIARWSGHEALVTFREGPGAALARVDIDSGEREILQRVNSGGVPGGLGATPFVPGPDPGTYAYDVSRYVSQMFLVTGAR